MTVSVMHQHMNRAMQQIARMNFTSRCLTDHPVIQINHIEEFIGIRRTMTGAHGRVDPGTARGSFTDPRWITSISTGVTPDFFMSRALAAASERSSTRFFE